VTHRLQDIWSIGCTVYEMITTRPPWYNFKDLDLLMKIAETTKPPEYPILISDELRDFLDSCFQIEP